MNRRIFQVFIALLISFIVIVGISLFVLFAFWRVNVFERQLPPKNYQFLLINTETNHKSYGFVTLMDDLEDEEFLSYEEGENNFVLISNLGNEEYLCTGKCYCEEKLSSRKSSTMIPGKVLQVLSYLVAASSAILAHKLAGSYFRDICVVKMESECKDENKIVSEVDDCEQVYEEINVEKDEYLCSGYCVNMVPDEQKHMLPDWIVPLFDEMKEFGCEKLKLEKKIDVFDAEKKLEDIIIQFGVNDLYEFCKSNSHTIYRVDNKVHWYCRSPFRSPYTFYEDAPIDNKNPHCRKVRTVVEE